MSLAILVVLPLAAAAESAPTGGARIVPLSYHPYPDDSDPLGVPAVRQGDAGWDYFMAYYSFLFDKERDGFSFPSLVADGLRIIEGVPGGDYAGTLAAYREAFETRHALESPITMRLNVTLTADAARVDLGLETSVDLSREPLVAKWVLVEDDVYYKPPPALSNGVFIHRFTVRAFGPLPGVPLELAPDRPWARTHTFPLDPSWDRENLYVAAWVQNEDETSSRFDLGEVVQAGLHLFKWANATVQTHRGVLLEIYTATWCPACLYGDNALNTLANEEGLRSLHYAEPKWRYIRYLDPVALWSSLLVGVALATVVLPPGGPVGLARRLRRRPP